MSSALHGATLRVAWSGTWPRSLGVVRGGEEAGEVFRDDERVRLEVEGQEWWVELGGVRPLRGVVTDPEGAVLLLYAGTLDWGGALTRGGTVLTVDVGNHWKGFAPLPGRISDAAERTLLEVEPVWEAGSAGWVVRTGRHPGAADDVAPALALWGALVLERWRAPWLRLATLGLGPDRVEAELEALRSRMEGDRA